MDTLITATYIASCLFVIGWALRKLNRNLDAYYDEKEKGGWDDASDY